MKKEKVKINKENLFKSKARMSYLQIFLLILSSFAFSYIIYESSKLLDGKGENINKLKQEIKNKKVLLIASFFKAWISRSKINLVSAQESISLNCCPKLKNNAVCQEILASNCNNECSVNCLPAKCELTSSCKLGCCFNSEEGTCSNSATKGKCEEDGGMWKDDKNCNIQECNLGCCILGSNTQFVTEKRCDKLASFYGYAFDFKPGIRTEIECLLLSNQQAEGACIIGEEEGKNLCEFTSKADCLKMIGNANKFYENYLCSNPSLNTGCEKQKTTSCVEGKDEVYWFDSCGNRENIFSEDKDKSWNSGKLLKKEESCNPNSANSESKSCGNCNYFLGSICGKSDDGKEKVCKSLDCKNAPDNVGKKDRRNGESWCVFDSYIGEGKDVPGSRHYKYYCLDGEVKAEACGDYRTGICVSDEIELGNNKKISQAACRLNRALECQG